MVTGPLWQPEDPMGVSESATGAGAAGSAQP